jgi:hypothetical protein
MNTCHLEVIRTSFHRISSMSSSVEKRTASTTLGVSLRRVKPCRRQIFSVTSTPSAHTCAKTLSGLVSWSHIGRVM